MSHTILCGNLPKKVLEIGTLLAQRTNKRFIDSNHLIEGARMLLQKSQFSEQGIALDEKNFPLLENNLFLALSEVKSCVIYAEDRLLNTPKHQERLLNLGKVIYLKQLPEERVFSFVKGVHILPIDGLTPDQIVDAILKI